MNKQQVVVLTPSEVAKVTAEQLPTYIGSSLQSIVALEDSVTKFMNLAEQARDKAENANIHVGLFNKKDILERLQDAAKGTSASLISMAEAQKISFAYQSKLGEITRGLFVMGAGNIAANRTIVRELKLQLEGASEEEISDLARQELLSVIKQLKAQEDLLSKQEQLERAVHTQSVKLDEQIDKNDEQDCILSEQAEKDEIHDRLLAEQMEKDEIHDRLLAEQMEKDEAHDRLLAEQMEKDEAHDRLLSEQAEKDEIHDRLLAEQAEKDAAHDRLLSAMEQADRLQEIELEREENQLKLLTEQMNRQLEGGAARQREIQTLQTCAKGLELAVEDLTKSAAAQKETLGQTMKLVQQQAEEIAALKTRLTAAEDLLRKKLFKILAAAACTLSAAALILSVIL